jgi:hypothetical protein
MDFIVIVSDTFRYDYLLCLQTARSSRLGVIFSRTQTPR